MAVIRSLVTMLKADTTGFNSSMKKASGFTKTFKRNLLSLAKVAGAAFAAQKLFSFAKESVQLFARQEQAVRDLAAALKLAGDDSAGAVKDMEAFASGIQKVTVYGDETVLEMAKLGSSIGGLTGESLKEATRAAIGLSEAFGIDAVSAMRLVARAAVGDTTTLARYGIKLDSTKTKAQQFAQVLEIGTSKFELATEAAKTTSGRMAQFANTMGDLKERVGEGLVDAFDSLQKELAPLKPDILKLWESVKTLGSSLKNLWQNGLGDAAIVAIKGVVKALGLLAKAFDAVAAAHKAFQPDFGSDFGDMGLDPADVSGAKEVSSDLADLISKSEAFRASLRRGEASVADIANEAFFLRQQFDFVDVGKFDDFGIAGDSIATQWNAAREELGKLEDAVGSVAKEEKKLAWETQLAADKQYLLNVQVEQMKDMMQSVGSGSFLSHTEKTAQKIADVLGESSIVMDKLRDGSFGVQASSRINIRGLAGAENVQKDQLSELKAIRRAVERQGAPALA